MGIAQTGLAFAGFALLAAPACAGNAPQEVFDDFSKFDESKWYACRRPENQNIAGNFLPGTPLTDGLSGLKLGVEPKRAPVAAALLSHTECDATAAAKDMNERAEIWEQDCLFEKYGTEIWQRFSLFVDPLAEQVKERLVIGQWKKGKPVTLSPCRDAGGPAATLSQRVKKPEDDWGPSPFLALRFERREFSISIEQRDLAKPKGEIWDECRITLAVDDARPINYLRVLEHGLEGAPAKTVLVAMIPRAESESVWVPDAPQAQNSCMRGLAIERYGALPNPFGHWVTIQLHFAVAGGSGFDADYVEVWANGWKVAKASGRIGSAPPADIPTGKDTPQYFKFGPYRNMERAPLTAWIANYSRAGTLQKLK